MRALGAGAEQGDFAPIAPGVYKAIVRNFEYHTGPSRRGLNVVFKIMEEQYKNRTLKLMDWVTYDDAQGGFTYAAKSKLGKVMEVFSSILNKPVNTINIDDELIEARVVKCYIKIENNWSEKDQKNYSNVVEVYNKDVYKGALGPTSTNAPVNTPPVNQAPAAAAPQAPVNQAPPAPPATQAPKTDKW